MSQVINFLQSSETNTVDNSTLTVNVNQTYPYGWQSQSTFNGAFLSYENIDIETNTPATSTANSSSPNINLVGQKWNLNSIVGTVNSGSVQTPTGTQTAYAYIDGTQVATISTSTIGENSTTFAFPSGSHTLTVKVVASSGVTSSKLYSAGNFDAYTATLTINFYVINQSLGIYGTYATSTYETGTGSSQPVTNSIATDANGDLVLASASGQSVKTTHNVLDDGSGNMTVTGGLNSDNMTVAGTLNSSGNMNVTGTFDTANQIQTTIQGGTTFSAIAWTGAAQMSAVDATGWTNNTGRTCFVWVIWNSSANSLTTSGTVFINLTQNTSTGKIYFLIMANGASILNSNFVGYGVYWVSL